MSKISASAPLPSKSFNREHRKQLLDVPLASKNVLRRDGTGAPLKGGSGAAAITDGNASVDLTTLTPNGLILAFHRNSKGLPSGEDSSMIRLEDIAPSMRERVKKLAEKAARKDRGGRPAPASRQVLTVDPKRLPSEITPRFKFAASNGKPVGRLVDYTEEYGKGVQVGAWNTPGNGTVGAGGIRTLLHAGDSFHVANVKPVVVRDANPRDGVSGSATFVYGYVENQGKREYMWTLESTRWVERRNGKPTRSGEDTFLD